MPSSLKKRIVDIYALVNAGIVKISEHKREELIKQSNKPLFVIVPKTIWNKYVL